MERVHLSVTINAQDLAHLPEEVEAMLERADVKEGGWSSRRGAGRRVMLPNLCAGAGGLVVQCRAIRV